jgi:hypothetical protein
LLLWTASTVDQVAGLLLDEPIPQLLAQVHETIVEDAPIDIYYAQSGSLRTEPGGQGLCAPAVLVGPSDVAIDREVVFESVGNNLIDWGTLTYLPVALYTGGDPIAAGYA